MIQDMQMLISLHSPIMDRQEVEHVNYSGQATTLLGLASYSTTYSNGCGLTQGWYLDSGLNSDLDNNAGIKTRQ